jgi:hypothetical protein
MYDIKAQLAEANRKAHAEKLQAARDGAEAVELELYGRMAHGNSYADVVSAISRLIDAKVELALLERGGG